jgi:hypothetical protein
MYQMLKDSNRNENTHWLTSCGNQLQKLYHLGCGLASINWVVSMGLESKLEPHKCEALRVIGLSISLGAARIFLWG